MKRSFIREILDSINENTISFAGGLPNKELFPSKDFKKISEEILGNKSIYQYSSSLGIKSLREQIAKQYTKDGFKTSFENILITTGSQQALFIISKLFENKNITIEEPSYLGAMSTFNLNNINCDSVKLNNDGIDISKFEKSFCKTKLAYLIPDFQNPSSHTYKNSIRKKVADIIKENNGILIEDSAYSKLYFKNSYSSISKNIPNNSFHLGSFSKTLSPSLRVGYIRASKELINSLLPIKESMDLHTCGISQHILNQYLKDNSKYENHLKILREDYKDRMNYFCKCLDKYLPSFSYKKPKGGMFIYGKFENIDSYKLVQKCIKENILFVPGNQFYKNKTIITGEIRFNFTNSSYEDMKIGLKKIGNMIKNT